MCVCVGQPHVFPSYCASSYWLWLHHLLMLPDLWDGVPLTKCVWAQILLLHCVPLQTAQLALVASYVCLVLSRLELDVSPPPTWEVLSVWMWGRVTGCDAWLADYKYILFPVWVIMKLESRPPQLRLAIECSIQTPSSLRAPCYNWPPP